MNISELTKHVNRLTDEAFPVTDVVQFLNDGISIINTECDANFPFLNSEDGTSEPVIPEKWQRTLLVPYAAARIKQNDSSQFEYTDLYAQFEHSLRLFKIKYKVPDEYKDTSSGPMIQDFKGHYNNWSW
jgi:hypothetical protein